MAMKGLTMLTNKTSYRLCSALFLTLAVVAIKVQAKDRFSVAILMFDDVQIIDFAAPYEVFGQARFDVFTVSKDGGTVTTVMGLSVNPDYSFASMPEADAILVPGGSVHDAMKDKAILAWLKEQQQQTEHILSVCTGSHILAESGLLDNLSATTFHKAIPNFAQSYPQISVHPEKRFVDNGQIITSAGLSSGVDASLHLVSKVLGLERARSVALHIEYDWDPQGGFVRAMMADRLYPKNDYDWPDEASFSRVSSFGDKSGWRQVYAADYSASPDDLLAAYSKAMTVHQNWKPLPGKGKNQLSWQGQGDRKNWFHHVTLEHTGVNNLYHLAVIIEQAE